MKSQCNGFRACDFRLGCAIIVDLFHDNAATAYVAIQTHPHLAECLIKLGWTTDGHAAVDMALAIQDARTCPPLCCGCFAEKALSEDECLIAAEPAAAMVLS